MVAVLIPGMHRLLNTRDKTRLRHLTEAIERETGVEIAVLVVRRADDVLALARGYFNHVGIGKYGRDNGVLVLVAMDNRAIHIELGRGLATAVRPEDARRIIDHVIAPQFRHGRFGEGLVRGAEALGHLVRRAEAT
ncbi:MAG TPA: TPM domain-containing protein [bacterium]|nr:TPM domain-containing protein [bacterium]